MLHVANQLILHEYHRNTWGHLCTCSKTHMYLNAKRVTLKVKNKEPPMTSILTGITQKRENMKPHAEQEQLGLSRRIVFF